MGICKNWIVFRESFFWPIDSKWAVQSFQCVNNVWLHFAPPPSLFLLRERGPPPSYVYAPICIHASCPYDCIDLGDGLSVFICVCLPHVSVRGWTRPVRFHVHCNRTSLPTVALLLVATVTKAKSGVAAAAKRRARDSRKRQRFSASENAVRTQWGVRRSHNVFGQILSRTCKWRINSCL